MNVVRASIDKIFKGAMKSFSRFPSAVLSALVIAAVALIRITLDYEVQSDYYFFFNVIQLSFLLGAVSSMALIAYDEVYGGKNKSTFWFMNLVSLGLAGVTCLLLYYFGGVTSVYYGVEISEIALARVMVLVVIAVIAFVYIMSRSKAVDLYSDAFFIFHKAFMVSAIYALVIFLGVSGVIAAFQTLVYRGLDYRIYQYLGVIVLFLSFTLFLGYFPSFKGISDSSGIEEKPRFIVVLFGQILVPIVIALTLVLLLWSLNTLIGDMKVSFVQLAGIASTYVFIGLWLHVMVSEDHNKLASFYRRVYPYAGLLILLFEAWALFVQIQQYGFKTTEYSFLVMWVFAMISMILIILYQEKSYRKISLFGVIVLLVWVMPLIGYQDVAFNSQVKRLEMKLVDKGYLKNEVIAPVAEMPDLSYRSEITDKVGFISESQKKDKPIWFSDDLNDNQGFKNAFGFEKVYGEDYEPTDDEYTSYELKSGVIDISEYSISLNVMVLDDVNNAYTFKGTQGTYELQYSIEDNGSPQVKLLLEGEGVIEESLDSFIKNLIKENPSYGNRSVEMGVNDMSFTLDHDELSILFVFNTVDVTGNAEDEHTYYYASLQGVYVKLK